MPVYVHIFRVMYNQVIAITSSHSTSAVCLTVWLQCTCLFLPCTCPCTARVFPASCQRVITSWQLQNAAVALTACYKRKQLPTASCGLMVSNQPSNCLPANCLLSCTTHHLACVSICPPTQLSNSLLSVAPHRLTDAPPPAGSGAIKLNVKTDDKGVNVDVRAGRSSAKATYPPASIRK